MVHKNKLSMAEVLMALSAVVIFFFIAFISNNITESEKVTKKVDGLEVVSGMVLLDSILDDISVDNNLVISAKDGKYYFIEKRGSIWYFKGTAVKVSADNMDNEFNYYLINNIPYEIEITYGSPNTVLKDNGLDIIGNMITGLVTSSLDDEYKSYSTVQIKALIVETAKKYNVDPDLALSVAKVESDYRHYKDDGTVFRGESANEYGIMQLKPSTAEMLRVEDPTNLKQNIDGGIRYLKQQLDTFDNNYALASAAYNTGPGNVKDGIPNPEYVIKVYDNLDGDARESFYNSIAKTLAKSADNPQDYIAYEDHLEVLVYHEDELEILEYDFDDVLDIQPSGEISLIAARKTETLEDKISRIEDEIAEKEQQIAAGPDVDPIQQDYVIRLQRYKDAMDRLDTKYSESNLRRYKIEKEKYEEAHEKYTISSYSTKQLIDEINKPQNDYRGSIARDVLESKLDSGNLKTMTELANDDNGKYLLFEKVPYNEDVKKYVLNNRKSEYQIYTDVKSQCRDCEFKNGEIIDTSTNKVYELKLTTDGLDLHFIRQDDPTTSGIDLTEEQKKDRQEQLLKEAKAIQGYNLIEADGSYLLQGEDGKLYIITSDAQGRIGRGSELKEAPNKITIDGKTFTKKQEYKHNGIPVYLDSKKRIYSTKDLNKPLEKGTEITLSEKYTGPEGKQQHQLEKTLTIGENGELTSEVARTSVRVGDTFYEIDLTTYNALKVLKDEDYIDPTYESATKTLKVSIGDKYEYTFKNYFTKEGKESGIKISEQFETAFFYDGKKISKAKADELKKEGKQVETLKIHKSQKTEEKKDGELTYLTTYDFDIKIENGRPIEISEATKYDMDKKELVSFTYKEGDQEATFKDGKWTGATGNILNEAQWALRRYKSREFFRQFEFVLTEFRGLGYFASWFMGDEAMDQWRENVDKVFAQMHLGIEYWESSLCQSKVERDSHGVAYVDTRLGLAGVAAHIQASRSAPITTPNATEYLYKITFNVRNGDWKHDPKAIEDMEFNIFLYGDRRVKLLENKIKLDKGEAFGKNQENSIVQFSKFYYDKICIEFKEVPYFWSLDDESLCNKISGPPEEAEPYSARSEASSTATQAVQEEGILKI